MSKIKEVTLFIEPRGYALETLINGNFSHCCEYLAGLRTYLYKIYFREIMEIRNELPDRFNAIHERVEEIHDKENGKNERLLSKGVKIEVKIKPDFPELTNK